MVPLRLCRRQTAGRWISVEKGFWPQTIARTEFIIQRRSEREGVRGAVGWSQSEVIGEPEVQEWGGSDLPDFVGTLTLTPKEVEPLEQQCKVTWVSRRFLQLLYEMGVGEVAASAKRLLP